MDVKKFKSLLLERKATLMEVDKTGKEATQTVELDQASVGRLSRMDAMQVQAMAIATDRRRQLELQRIEVALNRIKNKEFGYCLVCGETIAEPRLKLDPATTLCIRCAEKQENK